MPLGKRFFDQVQAGPHRFSRQGSLNKHRHIIYPAHAFAAAAQTGDGYLYLGTAAGCPVAGLIVPAAARPADSLVFPAAVTLGIGMQIFPDRAAGSVMLLTAVVFPVRYCPVLSLLFRGNLLSLCHSTLRFCCSVLLCC